MSKPGRLTSSTLAGQWRHGACGILTPGIGVRGPNASFRMTYLPEIASLALGCILGKSGSPSSATHEGTCFSELGELGKVYV